MFQEFLEQIYSWNTIYVCNLMNFWVLFRMFQEFLEQKSFFYYFYFYKNLKELKKIKIKNVKCFRNIGTVLI